MNRMNSRNGFAFMTAPLVSPWLLLLSYTVGHLGVLLTFAIFNTSIFIYYSVEMLKKYSWVSEKRHSQ